MTMKTTEGNVGGASLLRRMILMLAVAAVIAAMMAATAAPAFAKGRGATVVPCSVAFGDPDLEGNLVTTPKGRATPHCR
jgi:hypothetical protein